VHRASSLKSSHDPAAYPPGTIAVTPPLLGVTQLDQHPIHQLSFTMYKVKAVYDYASPHEDDLDFKIGQIISVTEEEGDDWYVGEYMDDSGTKRDGLFPRNFVERYEPAPPPRPNRASRYKPLEQPAAQEAPSTPQMPQQKPEPVQREEPAAPKPQPPPLEVPQAAKATPLPMSPISPPSASSARAQEPPPVQAESSKPAPAAKKPPPVAAKSNAFRDRIAAFNAPAAAPIQPFKPSGGAPASFIKKPFVAPPPSRNAYVAPSRDPPPQIKTYRREEDPEIAERRAQDQNDAERAGLVSHDAPKEEAEEEQQPKVSLKERIALLQKQQQEQAERAAAMHKEKPKRPPVAKRTESHDVQAEDSEDTGLERVASGASKGRVSMDHRPPRTSHDIRVPESQHRQHDLVSENDADQSGAGETTEDGGGESTSVEDDEVRPKSRHAPPPPPARAAAAPAQEPDVGDEQDVVAEEEEEEDEMDAEARRKLELRERMAKMSGGMGMPGMFGGMPMGGLPPKKKSTTEKRAEESGDYASPSPQQRVPMFGMPGMASVRSPEQDGRQLSVEKEDEVPHPVTGTHPADEVPDIEDVTPQPIQRTNTGERPPPTPSDSKFLIPRKPIDVFAHHAPDRFQLPCSETVSKTYTAFDGVSEYVMTVCVSSMSV
jgi:hypothetical protein